MGVKSLSKFIETHAPGSLTSTSLKEYSHCTLAVDVSIYMYRFSSVVNDSPDMCCMQFMKFHKKLKSHNIYPVYVFDGFPPKTKIHTINKRKEKQAKSNRVRVTGEHFRKLKECFDKMGFDHLTANGDAEKTCSWMCFNRIADAVVSDDYDALVYGAPRVVRNVNSNNVTEIDLNRLLQDSELNFNEFVTLCVLSGCDFTPQGMKMGFKKAFEMIKSDVQIPSEFCDAVNEFRHKDSPTFGKVKSRIMMKHVMQVLVFVCCAKKILWIGK